ncbi:hypothetical protein PIB30_086706 [Stylosanthes scabra]|uniref:Uncharacterized protein n=1 Tax=Stylosanthes scabra TaxID=79078 RepID=A0ABU6SU45_9FABA|nr:hypothetical protein [Stylosanthes scabra]
MDQGTIWSKLQKEIEEIKIATLESEKAIEEENSRRELNSNFQDQIFPHEEQEMIFDMSSSSDMDDIPEEELVEDFVCAEIEASLKGDDVQMTNIFYGDTNIHDDVKNVSGIGLLEKSNDCEVKNNVMVEVEVLRSMKPSKFSVDLNEKFDSSMVCIDFVVRDCVLPPIDKKNKKEEIIIDYVQYVPSSTSIIQLMPQSQLELVQLSHEYFLSPHQYALLESDYQLQVICDKQHKSHVEGTTIKKDTLRAFQWSQRDGIHKTYKDKGHALSEFYKCEFSSLKKSNLRTIKQSA